MIKVHLLELNAINQEDLVSNGYGQAIRDKIERQVSSKYRTCPVHGMDGYGTIFVKVKPGTELDIAKQSFCCKEMEEIIVLKI